MQVCKIYSVWGSLAAHCRGERVLNSESKAGDTGNQQQNTPSFKRMHCRELEKQKENKKTSSTDMRESGGNNKNRKQNKKKKTEDCDYL